MDVECQGNTPAARRVEQRKSLRGRSLLAHLAGMSVASIAPRTARHTAATLPCCCCCCCCCRLGSWAVASSAEPFTITPRPPLASTVCPGLVRTGNVAKAGLTSDNATAAAAAVSGSSARPPAYVPPSATVLSGDKADSRSAMSWSLPTCSQHTLTVST